MRSHVTKVYVDSRYSQGDGKTFDLHEGNLVMSPDTKMYLSEFSCVASWNTIDATNNALVVTDGAILADRILTIPEGPHDIDSLREAFEVALNATGYGLYTVAKVSTGASGSTYRSFEVTNALTFYFPQGDPRSTLVRIVDFPGAGTLDTLHKSTFIDLRRVHSVYVDAPGFGDYSTVAPSGSRNTIGKIPVLVGYGGLVHHQTSGSAHDCVRVGVSSINSITLELQDVGGTRLDLKGGSWSATLIFES